MNPFVLDGARLWIGDGTVRDGHVVVADGRIDLVGSGSYAGPLERLDLRGLALSPGLIDLMLLGGFDLSIVQDDPIEIARRSRDLLGANGITSEYPIFRHICNLETVKTYEGTHNIHTLVLGNRVTGVPAFT